MRRLAVIAARVLGPVLAGLLALAAPAAAAGPPFPPPQVDRAVYDTAGVLDPATAAQAEAIIDGIEARTGAEVAVYTQLVPSGVTTSETEAHARALMNQWGVGRKGFDDGLVIMFDLHEGDPCHGQAQLYAGTGFAAEFLTDRDRQAIFDNDMLPLLRECRLDEALLVALRKVDQSATPEQAGMLAFYRTLNAVLGLLVAPLLLVAVVGWGLSRWYRHGRDPVYLDDPSIHIPAPPPGLTPAAGAVVREGSATRRALTAASLDLAARGLLDFDVEPGGFLSSPKLAIRLEVARPVSELAQLHLQRARARPMDRATRFLHERLESIAGGSRVIAPDELTELGTHVSAFDSLLEEHVVDQGWFVEAPGKVGRRWLAGGIGLLVLAGLALFAGLNLPSDGLVLVAAALGAAGVFLMGLSRSMPTRTMPGAMIRAMLEAYRRTLEKTMAMARSMDEVVAASAIPLIEDPDDAVVWGVALGLQEEVEKVLERTTEDLQAGTTTAAWLPGWYGGGGSGDWSSAGGGWAPGVMSASPIPSFGGMMATLGAIGNSPSSSGSGGGFSGGGGGGGGGGAGGGF